MLKITVELSFFYSESVCLILNSLSNIELLNKATLHSHEKTKKIAAYKKSID